MRFPSRTSLHQRSLKALKRMPMCQSVLEHLTKIPKTECESDENPCPLETDEVELLWAVHPHEMPKETSYLILHPESAQKLEGDRALSKPSFLVPDESALR